MTGGVTFLATYFATKMFAGPYTGAKGKIPSWIFKIKNYRIHIHHWFISFLVSLLLLKSYALFSFAEFVILFGGSLGITVHGIKNYHDWKHIIVKE